MTQTMKSPGACNAGALMVRSISEANANQIAHIVSPAQARQIAARRFQQWLGRPWSTAKLLVELAGIGGRHE